MLAKIVLLGCCTFLANGASVKTEDVSGVPVPPLYHFGDKEYYIETSTKASHEQSSVFCKNLDMELVTIENKPVNDFLFNTIKSLVDTTSDFWTSGYRSGNIWYWPSTKQPISYGHWSKKKPSYTDNCLQVTQNSSDITMLWSGADCKKNNYIICEGDGHETTTAKSDSL